MLFYLFLLFTIVPLAELAVLIWIGGVTEWWVPFLLVIATGIAGAALARWQGWQVLERLRAESRAGRVPADALVDGFLILVAALLLVTPGVLTDFAGFALLIPPLRRLVKRGAMAWLRRHVEVRTAQFTSRFDDLGPRPYGDRDQIIEAKVVNSRRDE